MPIDAFATWADSGDLPEDGEVAVACGGSKRLGGTTDKWAAWRGEEAVDLNNINSMDQSGNLYYMMWCRKLTWVVHRSEHWKNVPFHCDSGEHHGHL